MKKANHGITIDLIQNSAGSKAFPWGTSFRKLAESILLQEGKSGHINIILTDDSLVRQLNRDYRKLDKVTDVLSFCWDPATGLLGEIYLAQQQIRKQAPEFGNSYRSELKRMLVHGILHLCGYDHLKPKDRKIMRLREEKLLGAPIYSAEKATRSR